MILGEAFAKRLYELVQEKGISIYKLSKDSDVHRSTIDSILNGEVKSPTLATLYQLCKGLNITVLQFLDCETMLQEDLDIYTRK